MQRQTETPFISYHCHEADCLKLRLKPITVKPCNNGFKGKMQGCLLLLKSALLKYELKEINGSGRKVFHYHFPLL